MASEFVERKKGEGGGNVGGGGGGVCETRKICKPTHRRDENNSLQDITCELVGGKLRYG